MSPFGLLHNKTYAPQQHHGHEVWLRFKVGSSYDQVRSQDNLAMFKPSQHLEQDTIALQYTIT